MKIQGNLKKKNELHGMNGIVCTNKKLFPDDGLVPVSFLHRESCKGCWDLPAMGGVSIHGAGCPPPLPPPTYCNARMY